MITRRGFLAGIAGATSLLIAPIQKVWADVFSKSAYVGAVIVDFRDIQTRHKTARQDLEDAMREHGVI